jgi:polyisoprenoid-binding protein YceI
MRPRPPAALAWLALLAVPLAAQEPRTFTVDASASSVLVLVGKAGLFKFAGHEHEVAAPVLRGEVVVQPDVHRSSISLSFDAAALKVTGKGEPAGDVAEVQDAMIGPKVLDAARFPAIAFRSLAVSGRETGSGTFQVNVAGELTLHGTVRQLTAAGRVEVEGDVLTVTAELPLRQTDYGMTPVTAAGGTVKVKDEVTIRARIVARAAAP